MSKRNFVICIENSNYPAFLEKRKIYEVVPDESASEVGHIRVIDESGEDYLFPASCFIDAHLPEAVEEQWQTLHNQMAIFFCTPRPTPA